MNKWKLTQTNFQVNWMKIMRDITQLHELSEQPMYIINKCSMLEFAWDIGRA